MHAKHQSIALIVAIILIFTQALGVVHELDSSAHDHDQGCEICVHLSTLDAGLSTSLIINLPTFLVLVPKMEAPKPLFIPFLSTYLSRAPPVHSS
jgi:hypothetical protein